MCEQEELENVYAASLSSQSIEVLAPPLPAAVYRTLWLDAADELGLIAEILADVLGWERTPERPLPDALELAGVAAERIVELEGLLVGAEINHRAPRNSSSKTRARHNRIISVN